jgi:hypothetical protein
MAEKDFAVVQCQEVAMESDCAVFQACNLKRALHRAVDAFMEELDKVTFDEAVGAPAVAASMLGMTAIPIAMPVRGSRAKASVVKSVHPVHHRNAAAKVGPRNQSTT